MLQWDPKLNGDPRTLKLARELACGGPQARGHLITLFSWMVSYAPDGCLAGIDHAAIAAGAEWAGEPDTLLKALIKSQWCDRNGRMAEWQTVASEALEEQRQAEYRRLTRALYNNDALRRAVRARDGDACYFCARPVNFHDKRGPRGGTYARKDARGEWDELNTVVACRECVGHQPTPLRLVPNQPSSPANGKKLTVPDTADNLPSASSAEKGDGEKLAVGPESNGKLLAVGEEAFLASLSSNPERQIIHRASEEPRTEGAVTPAYSGTPEITNSTTPPFGGRSHTRTRESGPANKLELTEGQRSTLVDRWKGKFPGGADEVAELIAAALVHDSRKKWGDAFVYVHQWLKRDAERRAEQAERRNGRAVPPARARPPRPPSEFARFRNTTTPPGASP